MVRLYWQVEATLSTVPVLEAASSACYCEIIIKNCCGTGERRSGKDLGENIPNSDWPNRGAKLIRENTFATSFCLLTIRKLYGGTLDTRLKDTNTVSLRVCFHCSEAVSSTPKSMIWEGSYAGPWPATRQGFLRPGLTNCIVHQWAIAHFVQRSGRWHV